jgi:tetratricopeptide (TPR) repeat protein
VVGGHSRLSTAAYKKPGRVLVIWGVTCAALAALLLAYDVALAQYGTRLQEQDYRTYLGIATEHLAGRDDLGALTNVELAKKLAPTNPEPYAYAGGIHYRLENWKQAIENLEKAVEFGDPSKGPRMDIVWSHIELGRHEAAAALGERFAAEVQDNTALLQYAAEAHLRAKHPEKAIPLLKQALRVSPDNLYQLSRLAGAYKALGKMEDAGEIQGRIDAIHDAIGQLGNSGQ